MTLDTVRETLRGALDDEIRRSEGDEVMNSMVHRYLNTVSHVLVFLKECPPLLLVTQDTSFRTSRVLWGKVHLTLIVYLAMIYVCLLTQLLQVLYRYIYCARVY